jgi:hypothetical protein
MEQTVWDQATQTAHSLGLITSQFLSRLVDETAGEIGRGGLLDRDRPAAPGSTAEPS